MRALFTFFLCIFLAACNAEPAPTLPEEPVGVGYKLTIKNDEKREELIEMSKRVLRARIHALANVSPAIEVEEHNGQTLLRLELEPELFRALTQRLYQPLDLELMVETSLNDADVIVAESKGFEDTDMRQKDVQWVSVNETNPSTPVVHIHVNNRGAEDIEDILEDYANKDIRLFLRKRPVSIINPSQDVSDNVLDIENIVSAELGHVFAEDVNVGLFVDFVPLPTQ